MDYKVISRPKLPRNKYGDTDKASGGGTLYFSDGNSSISSDEVESSIKIKNFVGSTSTADGESGLVPAPKCNVNEPLGTINDNKKFLKGTGAWVDIPISRYTEENTNEDGINLNGNLSVSDTLTTQTLNVLGSAHFWELIIDKVKSTSGNLLITPANMEVDYVGNDVVYPVNDAVSPYKEMFFSINDETGILGLKELFTTADIVSMTAKRLYMKNDDNVHSTLSDFKIGDMVRCKTLNLKSDASEQYKVLDYIELDGHQYINTGVELNTAIDIETQMDLQLANTSGTFETAFGNMYSGTQVVPRFGIHKYQSKYMISINSTDSDSVLVDTQPHTIKLKTSSEPASSNHYTYTFSVDGTDRIINRAIGNTNLASTPMLAIAIGARYQTDNIVNYLSGKIGRTYLKQNNILLYDLIPVLNPSGVAGMWDTVSQTFYPSEGTEDFIAGNETGEIIYGGSQSIDANKDYWTFVLNTGYGEYNDEPCKFIDVFKSFKDSENHTYGLNTLIDEEGIQGNVPYSTSDNELSGITEFKFGYGEFNPEVGDNIVSLGHLWEGERQSAILISSIDPMDAELKAPALAQYQGINRFTTLSPFRTTSIAANGNNFEGKFLVSYDGNYIDLNERLNIFTTDLNTGLEAVGIHLDGDNSTIKMVGSVEVRQNDDGEIDTLTVWDEDDVLRVKISPEAIPSLSNISSSINPSSTINFKTKSGQDQPTSYSIQSLHEFKYLISEKWSWDHRWTYWTENAYFRYTSTVDLGDYRIGDKFSISKLYTSIRSKAYFKGADYCSIRSDSSHSQSIGNVILTLQRYNNGVWETVGSSYNLSNSVQKSVSAESATISLDSTILDNYEISRSGKYRLYLEIIHNVFAKTNTYTSEQTNTYFTFDYTVKSSVYLIQPSAAMTRIGRNGMVFNTDNSGQYFYAGNNGIEMKWGDVGVRLDSTYGYRRYKKIYTVSTSGSSSSPYTYSIPIDADVIFVNGSNVRLITVASGNIPEGKDLIVVGNSTTSYGSANTIVQNVSISVRDAEQSEIGSGSTTLVNYRKHFIWHNLDWWEI